jgi:hypothetical protein
MRDGGFHYGQDFEADDGTPFYACAGGTVKYIGPAQGYGQWIVIDHPDEEGGGVTTYGHMWNAFATGLKQNDTVARGQLLGYVGSNGESSGPHLHLTVMPYGYDERKKINPLPWLADAEWPEDALVTNDKETVVDTLFADVSEFQSPVNDLYPYPVLSFRSNDGTYRDSNFWQNYRWANDAINSGRLAFFIVYFYWRPNWEESVNTLIDMVTQAGGPHPRMAVMIDVESGGNPGGDQSDGINRSYWKLADWIGDRRRICGYVNQPDAKNMWPSRPDGIRIIAAGYGTNPNISGQIAHQYTDGQGYGGGLPEGCPPFGNCDMNSADGLSAEEFAEALGISLDNSESAWTAIRSQFSA